MSVRRLALAFAASTAMMMASNASAAPDQAAMQMLPGDTSMVISFDLARIRKAPLYKTMMEMVKKQPDGQKALAEIKAKSGVDLEKDIDRIVVALPANVEKSESFVLMVKGRLDQGKLTSAAMSDKNAGGKEGSHNGVKTVSVDNGQGSFAFLNGYMLAGSTSGVHKAIDASKGKGALKGGKVSAAIAKVDTGKDMWMVIDINDTMRKNMPSDPMAKSVTGMQASLDLASGLGLKMALSTKDAASAKQIADTLSAQLNAQNKGAPPMFANMMKKITAKAAGSDVNIEVALSQQDVDMLKGLLMMGMAAGGNTGAPQK